MFSFKTLLIIECWLKTETSKLSKRVQTKRDTKVIQTATKDGKNEYLIQFTLLRLWKLQDCSNYSRTKYLDGVNLKELHIAPLLLQRVVRELNNVEVSVMQTDKLCEKKTKES